MIDRIVYIITTITKYPLVFIAISCLTQSIASERSTEILSLVLITMCIILLIITKRQRYILIFLVVSLLFNLRCSFVNFYPDFTLQNYYDQNVEIIAQVKFFPIVQGINQKIILQPKFIGDQKTITKSQYFLMQTKVSKFEKINKGDLILLKAKLIKPPVFENFNYPEYLKSNKIYGVLENVEQIKVVNSANSFLDKLRFQIIKQINQNLPEPHAGLLLGMLIGSRAEFDDEFNAALKMSGTNHIIAVSGYNVSVLIALVVKLAGYIPRKNSILLAACVLGCFLLIVGLDNLPALRAGLMGFAVLLANMSGKKSNVISLLALASVIMLFDNPYVYKSLSFQLSYAATIGLIFLADKLADKIKFITNQSFREELSVTFAALIATFPITFSNFGQVAIWAPLANLIIGPLVPMIMAIGGISLMFRFASTVIFKVFLQIDWILIEIMVRTINFTPRLPFSMIIIDNHNVTKYFSLGALLFLFLYLIEVAYQKSIHETKI